MCVCIYTYMPAYLPAYTDVREHIGKVKFSLRIRTDSSP